jgi:glycosyltransferase involved in cell wall biosynthesis
MKIKSCLPSRVGVAHPGTQHSWQTALAFQEASALSWYATSSYYKTSAWPDRSVALLPAGLRARADKELRRRRFDPLDDQLVRRAWETEALERPIGRFVSRDLMLRLQRDRHRRFPNRLLRLFSREPVDVVWGPHDCLEAFEQLKPCGVTCILDQPVGHFASLDRVIRAEHERHPDFFFSEQVGVSPEVLERQQRAAEVADLIVVGSDFAARTMVENSVAPNKVRIIPYGYDERSFPEQSPKRQPLKGRPAEFLFVGLVGARKGAAYLFEAFRRIDPTKARLTLVGPLDMPPETFRRYADYVNYVGSVTRPEVIEHMRRADCLVLPSLFEGSALVLYEALAMGLPIVQTASSGLGADDGVNGVVLTDLTVDRLQAAIEDATADPERLESWGEASWTMRTDRTWAKYRSGVRELVKSAT